MRGVWTDRLIALLLILAGYYLYGVAGEFPGDAELFPRVIVVLIIVLSILMLVHTIRKKPAANGRQKPGIPLKDILRPYAIFCCSLTYAALMGIVGFYPSTLGMGAMILLVLETKKPKSYILTIGGLMLFIYILFSKFLKVPFPTGILF
jgi:hypothetical protein